MNAPQPSLTATVIAIVPADRQDDTAATLSALSSASGVRPIIISPGDDPRAPRTDRRGTTVISGLPARYLDNAVASLRLSSLPAVVWWRAEDPRALDDLAGLVDRIVLDLDDPSRAWARVPAIARRAAVSDLRWTRLTRWRDLMAQFFEVPAVRQLRFERVTIAGADPHDAALFAGWLRSRLPGGRALEVIRSAGDGARLQSVELAGPDGRLVIRLLPNGTCLETTADVAGAEATSRVVARGDDRTETLLGEELRVRARDAAFEDAVRAVERS